MALGRTYRKERTPTIQGALILPWLNSHHHVMQQDEAGSDREIRARLFVPDCFQYNEESIFDFLF